MNSSALVGILFIHTVDSRPFPPLEEYLLVVCCKWIHLVNVNRKRWKIMEHHYVLPFNGTIHYISDDFPEFSHEKYDFP